MSINKKNRLTKEGYDKLVKELKHLKEVKYPYILERIAEAKAMGDLSENFEYKSAQEDRNLVVSKIAEIENLIENVEIIKESKTVNKKVDYGSVVTLKLEDGKEYVATIAGSGEVDFEGGIKMSLESPIGIAIKGKKVGDRPIMKIAKGKQIVEIISIK